MPGNRGGFRTDTAISNSRFGNERTLQRWVPDADDQMDGGLEQTASTGKGWDQFAENERLFGLKTNYNENYYTTAIDKSHPQYRERMAAAERTAKEIERSAPATAHVAEERVMDYKAGSGQPEENEEDKYSGVRRQQDFPPLSGNSGNNKYTPPARRAPTAQSTVKGAPVDPAIISSQIKKTPAVTPDASRGQTPEATKNGALPKPDATKTTASNAESKPVEGKPIDAKESTVGEGKASEKATQVQAPSTIRQAPASTKDTTPSATSTVERDVLKEFKSFATQQRMHAEKARTTKAKADKEVRLTELRKFANSFKLSTPVPSDLVSIIAKDPAKQKEIQAKAIKNAEDLAKAKSDAPTKEKSPAPKETQSKPSDQSTTTDAKGSRAPTAPQGTPPAGANGRQSGARQPYPQQQYHGQAFRGNRGAPQHTGPQQQSGTLAQRLRNVEQQKFSQPPTAADPNFNRRHSGITPAAGAKLNPNSHEFRPSPFAAAFNPNSHASAGSSPRSAVNNVSDTSAAPPVALLIRRKTKAVDVTKCLILSHIKTIKPPQGRKWDDNGGLRPAFDTLPTWRQLQDDEKADSTMHLTYKEYFERNPFAGASAPTPNPPHVVPHLAHQHQLPFHLQHGAGQRQSPHMSPMQMHNPQHGGGYGNDDHRMMHSNSQQSYASPRMGQMPMAYPGVGSPGQMQYNQQAYIGHGNPQMGQYRSFSNTPHYVPPQQAQMGGHMMMMQPGFMGPQGMVGGPQMMYPGAHPHFIPPSGPPQPNAGTNGYPSPGRPAAPAMAHQGSQQGQPLYGMSPSVQYNQPAYGAGQPNGSTQ